MKIKAVVFDMDGVLIDAKDWHFDALNAALRLFGMEISRYDHLVTYDGLPTRKKLDMLSQERGLPKTLHSFINRLKQQYTLDLVHQRCFPSFTHEYALSRLRSEGYRLALCSNSIRDTVEIMMSRARLTHYFDFMLSNEDVKQPKPDPEMYQHAIERLGLTPSEALVLEDNPHGIEAARRSGAHLLEVSSVSDANYQNIIQKICEIEKELC